MSIVSENYHENRLKEKGINIKTKYQQNSQILERNTDVNTTNEDVKNGIILNKTYIKNGKVLLVEKEFNPRILYTFLITNDLSKEVKCPNCGYIAKAKEFISGCPYCRTHYNIDYSDKNLGSRYHYDRIINNNIYLVLTFVLDLICSMLISFAYFINTGRTFTIFDIVKALGLGGILALLLYYIFYIADAYIITLPVKIIKDAENKKKAKFWQDMLQKNISKETFFNNLNMELQNYYYNKEREENKDIIDYDILEYNSYNYFFDNNKRINIKVNIEVREITLKNEKIFSNKIKREFTLRRNEIKQDKLNPGINIVMCHNCGASLDITKDRCEYCGEKINYMQSWYIVK